MPSPMAGTSPPSQIPNPRWFPCFKIPPSIRSGKLVLAAADDTESSHLSVAPANSAPLSSSTTRALRHSRSSSPLRTASFSQRSTTPGGDSSLSTAPPPPPSAAQQQRQQSISPNPSSIPSLPIYRATAESEGISSPDQRRTDSSAYYTTAWGSPYATPSPRRVSWSLRSFQGNISPDLGEVSPPPGSGHQSDNQEEGIISDSTAAAAQRRLSAANTQVNKRFYGSLGRQRVNNKRRKGKTIQDFTQDWIDQYLSGQPRTERTNWLSDDSGDSEAASFLTARNHLGEESEGWLGLDDDIVEGEEDLLKTPTAKSFFAKKARNLSARLDAARSRSSRHVPRPSTDTLKQEDFWDFGAHDLDMVDETATMPESQAIRTTELGSPADEAQAASPSPIDKPLPPPPVPERESTPASPAVRQKTPVSTRPRKKVQWKTKEKTWQCVIALPLDDPRGSEESGVKLFTLEDYAKRLKKWEEEGYDVTHIGGNDGGDALDGDIRSRPTFPDPVESQKDWEERNFQISFPNKGEWDAYVNFLQEEKLRALGVSLGDPEPAPTPSSVPMSQNSSQFPQNTMSPVPTSVSNQFNIPTATFSPSFNQSTQPTSNVGSLGSPTSQFGMPSAPSFPNQQGAFGAEYPFAQGFPFPPYQATPPAQGTFTPQSLYNARQDGVSPVGNANIPNLASMLPPISPLTPEEANQFAGTTNIFSHLKSPLSNEHQQPHRNDPSHLISPPSEESNVQIQAESETIESSSGPEIAHPAPRGHRHNVSESLQKDVEKAEYHLEDSIRRQLEDEEEQKQEGTDLLKSRWAIQEDNEERPSDNNLSAENNLNQDGVQQQRLFGERYQDTTEQNLDDAEIDTNPSLSGSPAFGHRNAMGTSRRPSHHPQDSSTSFQAGHASRTSLNVEAKEFDPSSGFPFNFSFGGGNNGLPTVPNFAPSNSIFSPAMSQNPSHSAHSSGFNISAMPFAPGGQQQQKKHESISSNANTGFKFSSASFNVDAPVFNPGRSFNFEPGRTSNAEEKTTASTEKQQTQPKIFGDFDPSSLIVKPARRSKAIPIVRPDEAKKNAEKKDEQEGDESRGGDLDSGRSKRARRREDDGDREPVFASPGDALLKSNDTPPSSREVSKSPQPPASEQKHVTEEPAAKSPSKAASPLDETPKDTPTSQNWKPFEFKNEAEAASFHAALPTKDIAAKGEKRSNEQTETPVEEPVESSAKEPEPKVTQDTEELNRTILKPTAAPFEFKGVSTPAPAPVPEPKPQPVEEKSAEPEPPKKSVGLEGSRYAVDSPITSPEPKYSRPAARAPSPKPQPVLAPPTAAEEHPEPSSATDKDAEHDSLDEQEIDAVMRQLNEDDSDLGIERQKTPRPQAPDVVDDQDGSEDPLKGPQLVSTHVSRSNAPSPSTLGAPNHVDALPRLNTQVDPQKALSPLRSPHHRASESPVRHLNNPENARISDWDDAISSGEDEKLQYRSRFFDRHVNEIVGNILENRLDPLERTLSVIQHSITLLASRSASQAQSQRRSVSAEVEESDADDEDEEEGPGHRSISPFNKRDRRADKIRQAVLDALAANQASRKDPVPNVDLSGIQDALAELKALSTSRSTQDHTADINRAVEEAIANHPRLAERAVDSGDVDHTTERLKMQVEGLQSMLRIADERAEKEYNARRDVQDSLSECQKLLRIAEEDAGRHHEHATSTEQAFREFKEKKIPEVERIEKRSAMLEEQQETLQLTLSELSKKNIALEETLDEYRVSGDHWRTELEKSKTEKEDLRKMLGQLKEQMEEGMRTREALRAKFDKLQDDMVRATEGIARDQSLWRKKEEDLNAKYNSLRAAYDREVRLREKLELDISDLEQQEKEATKLRYMFGQSQQENARLEEMIVNLRQENHDYQSKAARFEREFNDARESSRVEIQRVRTSLESDLEAANSQVNCVRVELESQISGLETQLENVKLDADAANARHEMLLEEAADSKRLALAEAAEAKETALQEQRLLHERNLNDLRERHARALHNASEDRQRADTNLTELMALRDEKIEHLQDKVAHLEEKLQIAKSAARAAAQAAQSATGKGVSLESPTLTSPSLTFAKGTDVPEKISPQALRESIMVLQDQLQQREGRIEELEQEVASFDKDAPLKLKEKETEINWLRELLGVRVDDLQDIINTLSQPSFNRHAVRDAIIRLKANIQMEQQEKERAMAGGSGGQQSFPSPLATIQNIAASPRSLPLAAAAAWGNWRKARENSISSNVSDSRADQQTPSKPPTSSQAFLSGLLTPPSSNIRQRPTNLNTAPPPGRRTFSESRPLRSYGNSAPRALSTRQAEKMPQQQSSSPMEPPTTPPLLRKSSYDHDAEATNYDDSAYGDDNESVIVGGGSGDSGMVPQESASSSSGPSDGPFGPAI